MPALLNSEEQKSLVAKKALEYICPGMRVGLGSGSTANHFIDLLSVRVRSGLSVICVPTSQATQLRAERLGIPLTTLEETPFLDITIDGADEIGPDLVLIKGGGGAHLREKIVAFASERMVVIAEARKKVSALGAFPLPLEIVRFGTRAILLSLEKRLQSLGIDVRFVYRKDKDDHPILSDNGNYLIDGYLGKIEDPYLLNTTLHQVEGIVAHGLCVGMASIAIIAEEDGKICVLERTESNHK